MSHTRAHTFTNYYYVQLMAQHVKLKNPVLNKCVKEQL